MTLKFRAIEYAINRFQQRFGTTVRERELKRNSRTVRAAQFLLACNPRDAAEQGIGRPADGSVLPCRRQ